MSRSLPTSTYRYQISPSFTLQDAAADLPRIVELGVDAVYLSPLLTSTTGSDHGYDWVDCTQVDPQRGGEAGWVSFVDAARAHGLKIVLDIVPNHCGISKAWENPAWWSVLREGRQSPYASWFDVDWDAGPILVPVLPADGSVAGLEFSPDRSELVFHEHRFPVAIGSADDGAGAELVASRQHYRLAPWQLDATELNYRRFFAVSSLAGLRVEDPRVFEATHERIFRMADDGQLDGIRIDHPDGLTDPGEYLRRLRGRVGNEIWIVVEKILADGEQLPSDWPVDGTSGYDAMAELTRLVADPGSEAALTDGYGTLTGDSLDVEQHVLLAKRQIAAQLFGSERARIQRVLPASLRGEPSDAALVEIAAHMDVYRTYLPHDRAALDRAASAAALGEPSMRADIQALIPVLADVDQEAARRFQQFTGALMAKGLEDTAWYRYTRWIGANEVGGHPGRLGTTVLGWHEDQARRQLHSPASMVGLSTHDTKRGEDVRAALGVLTELVDESLAWGRGFIETTQLPDRPFAWLLAQTLAAVGPIDAGRLHAYATKAMREANTETGWAAPNSGYEMAVHAAIDQALTDPILVEPLSTLRDLMAVPAGVNVLSQKVVALTMPGIPDVYRGTEFVEDSLVDPDNRRPVDLGRSMTELDLAKHHLVTEILRLRRDHAELFTKYRPIALGGPLAEHLVGYDRGGAITLATRLPVGLERRGGWGDSGLTLPQGTWRDVLSGAHHSGRVQLGEVFARHPAAVLVPAELA
ncbi:malto-oligosyltrehalose synthase [Aestuariimicrobium sp. p3-SID1156]|uniref:malto-oligosyltrehalose synthase n=1 Tax=Aestuariimicrobium sp. p3-SID1156 TaxID=2916038 RepID=UPI00223B0121|nr:malto-oligosyltrehalose synthase [Aestuariimicrobium sp. p3-SID1156]MCT1460109.1 malto-oligosyltrehalose synthase [Aestuariimicrobium sp. p3-SID1156]